MKMTGSILAVSLAATAVGRVPSLVAQESDRIFYDRGFERVRCSLPGATPYDPKGTKQAARKPLPTNEALFFPAKDLPKHRLIETITVGEKSVFICPCGVEGRVDAAVSEMVKCAA